MGDKKKNDKKHEKKSGKKDRQLIVRVTAEERKAFLAACEARDTSASREIRRFMKRFIAERDASHNGAAPPADNDPATNIALPETPNDA